MQQQKRFLRPKIRMNKARFELPAGTKIEYKNLNLIQKFLTDRGKIVSRRLTGLTAKQQRAMCAAIKQARFLGLISVGSAKRK